MIDNFNEVFTLNFIHTPWLRNELILANFTKLSLNSDLLSMELQELVSNIIRDVAKEMVEKIGW